jgi:F420-dependent oxidoreductase-like protein
MIAGHASGMRLGITVDYTAPVRAQLTEITHLERAGADVVWVPEAWGFDAPSLLGYLAATTTRVQLCSGVLPIYTRSPSLIAQTAATQAIISGGRFELGLGTSGPQVIEGFHGIPFCAPLARMKDTIGVCRALWSGATSRHDGSVVQIPPHEGTGLGKPLRLLAPEAFGAIPIHLAVMRPAMVALAAECADGWYPLIYTPEGAERVWGAALARGAAARDPGLGPIRVTVEYHCAIGRAGDLEPARAAARAWIARYVGGMGARGVNFYHDVVAALGWPEAAERIQDLYLDGRRADAAAAVPPDMLDQLTLIGDRDAVSRRVEALWSAGVATVVVRTVRGDQEEVVRALRPILDEVATR